MSNIENLDLACAQVGAAIAIAKQSSPEEEIEKLIQGALAVLEGQGVYALFLFLLAKNSSVAKQIIQKLKALLKGTPQQSPLLLSDEEDVLAAISDANAGITHDLDKLLLAHDLLRQALTYARYHAKVDDKKLANDKKEER